MDDTTAFQMLQHYTGQDGLTGIVRSQTIRAGEFLSMNDKSEWTYAYTIVAEEAVNILKARLPEELRNDMGADPGKVIVRPFLHNLKTEVLKTDGYWSLFITSFARGKSDHEHEHGILTLWDRYTRNKGFCLEFSWDNIRRQVDNERQRCSYAVLDLAEVKYGLERKSLEVQHLAQQMSWQMQRHLYNALRDARLAPDIPHHFSEQRFVRELLTFCGTHKNPHFIDEREVRILAVPSPTTEMRGPLGVTFKKAIYRLGDASDARRYISIGDERFPGILPDRIIVGPQAELSPWFLQALYPPAPLVRKSLIPIG